MSKKTLIKNRQAQEVSVPAGSRSASRKTSQLGERFEPVEFVPAKPIPLVDATPPEPPVKVRRSVPVEPPKKTAKAPLRAKRKAPAPKNAKSAGAPVFLQQTQQDRLSHLREDNAELRVQLERLNETGAKRPKT